MSLETRVEKGDEIVSPFHDIPFWVDKEKGIANMVVEIPRGQQAKLEISRDQPFNPIKQDVKVRTNAITRLSRLCSGQKSSATYD